jgi:hypothetical protein
MNPPEKSKSEKLTPGALTESEIDAIYGLEPALGNELPAADAGTRPEFVVVHCPYCGEGFETSADASAGPCKYVEDCQVCCQPIEMELKVDENGDFDRLLVRRDDS